MPYTVRFNNIPTGYAAATVRGGDEVGVIVSEFVSSEDGDKLVQRLEGFPSQILGMLPTEANLSPSRVHALVAVIRRDKTAQVFVNDEVQLVARALYKGGRPVKAGDALRRDDIAEITEANLADIEVPRSAGVVVLFSVGWRKGLFYDLKPIQPKGAGSRRYELGRALGEFIAYLLFNDLFKITEDDWKSLFAAGLFPFRSLSHGTIQKLLLHVREDWDLVDVLESISKEIDGLLDALVGNSFLRDQRAFVETAVSHFRTGDFLSSISVLFPRIEGIMRSHHYASGMKAKPTPANLAQSITSNEDIVLNAMLPDRFRRYLLEVFFRDFDPTKPAELSRHTVSHGVADSSEYSRTGALVGFLVLAQLAMFLSVFSQRDPGKSD